MFICIFCLKYFVDMNVILYDLICVLIDFFFLVKKEISEVINSDVILFGMCFMIRLRVLVLWKCDVMIFVFY